MPKIKILFLLILFMGIGACNDKHDDGAYADYLVARPMTMLKTDFRNNADILPPKAIEESGKLYAYQNIIFVNDLYKGVHVIDNSNPKAPQKIAFIEIAGNVDISIKDDYLYADSITDLLVFDISDISNIRQVNRLENVLRDNVVFPAEADFYEFDGIDYSNEIIVGWEVVTERRLVEEYQNRWGTIDFAMAEAMNDGSVGEGGSMARFKIVSDYLYAVDSHNINVFKIENLENPEALEPVFAGFDIETIFNRGNNLFLGSRSGMYIYDISSPATPGFISEFQHGTACDPVVVDDQYAYVTLRGGNECGATESGLFIVDITDIANPVLAKSYSMDGPYGLGIKGDMLFVCDGESGLKVYDKTQIQELRLLDHFKDIVTFDVIPLENQLLMVGDDVLYQYRYQEGGIEFLSSLNLD
ncbi:LVIVD repeat-containing protein [Sediminicola luteus]|uniref:LVIVD repeat-containing protein n=1 Tax=Sediminicola luteus TaxID=319238 RepID=A0ABV2TYY9_9FLAO